MPVILYERLCADDRRPSPYCWRARLAAAHKGLAPEIKAIKFTEADKVAFSGQGKVPVLVDGATVVADSWAIACHLEDAYPEAPTLFGGPGGRELARFVNHWADQSLQKAFAPILAPSAYAVVHGDDRAYYRETREAKWGMSFERMRAGRDAYKAALDPVLEPLRQRLAEAPFLCGTAPAYADYLAFGEFQWARCVDPEDLLAEDDRELRDWRARMLELFDGLARSVPAFDTAA
jgi:glutathione S-transferase